MTQGAIEPLTGALGTPRRRFLALCALAVGGGALSACGTASGSKTSGETVGSGKLGGRPGALGDTLFVSGFQWGPPTNFNPVGPSPAWPAGIGAQQLLFETLLRWDLRDGSWSSGVGKEYKRIDQLTIDVPLMEGTKWSDGVDLTADDVVFTFELARSNSLSFSNVWTYLTAVAAPDTRTVQFRLRPKPLNPGLVLQAISNVPVLPRHIWDKIPNSRLLTETNKDPVGSGPYKVEKYDQTQIILARRDDYWGKDVYGIPAPTRVAHPVFKSGADGDIKLESGEIDASQQFTPQIWKMWEKGKPVGTWLKDKPYYLPGNLPCLIFNLHKKGLDEVLLRRAIAYCIDYDNISTKAMSNYSPTINASLIVPQGWESKFFDQAIVDQEGWRFDKQKAVDILENELKCTKGSDGIYKLPDGTRLGPWKLITPTGWTDWNTACEIVAKSCQNVGIDVATSFPQAPTMTSAMQNGNFDMCMYSFSGVGPASPWTRFRDVLDDRGVPGIGKAAFQNYGRFKDAEVPALLDAAAAATEDAEKKQTLQRLDAIYRKNIPVVPLMYRPLEFFEFNETTWTNFPTEANAYAPPQWSGAGIGWIYKIRRTGSS